jgi:hypothetical protein
MRNPLLELKAKDEITEALKMYAESGEEGEVINFDEIETLPEEVDTEEIQTEEIFLEEPLNIQEEINDIFSDTFSEIQDEILPEDINLTDENQVTENPELAGIIDREVLITALNKINSGNGKEETDKLIIEACLDLVNAERGILFYPDDNNILKGKLFEEEIELTAGPASIAGKVFREFCVININDVFNDPGFNPSEDYISYFHIHNLICMPLLNSGKVKAVLQLFNNMNGEFSETDENILRSVTPVILKAMLRWDTLRNNGSSEERLADIAVKKRTTVAIQDKQISLRILMEFLLQEFQVITSDVKQFNIYLQRLDIPGEAKEISDIVTSQTSKIIDLLEALKSYSESGKDLITESQSYITLFDNMITLLAEYTEGRKVNLYKRFETDGNISANTRFLYLSVFQLIKYQCDLMPFGGNIFISSTVDPETIEVNIRNATKKTDESLVISPAIDYTENTPQGIGLSLAKRIIEDHNASLDIINQSGTGIEIIIRFPISG